ncbi:hypothetical protein U1Q18_022824 [Sarracenia purpurea var. burkii]
MYCSQASEDQEERLQAGSFDKENEGNKTKKDHSGKQGEWINVGEPKAMTQDKKKVMSQDREKRHDDGGNQVSKQGKMQTNNGKNQLVAQPCGSAAAQPVAQPLLKSAAQHHFSA